jgi:nitrogen fixation NifU-like protein
MDDIYNEIILDHYSNPCNRGKLENPTIIMEGVNPLCGDEISLYLLIENDYIKDVKFDGKGCSISQASASMMTEAIKGNGLSEVVSIIDAFKKMIQGEEVSFDLGDLVAFKGLRKFPSRVKCALLAWNTLQKALDEFRNKK